MAYYGMREFLPLEQVIDGPDRALNTFPLYSMRGGGHTPSQSRTSDLRSLAPSPVNQQMIITPGRVYNRLVQTPNIEKHTVDPALVKEVLMSLPLSDMQMQQARELARGTYYIRNM
jgi:hypothetical protein